MPITRDGEVNALLGELDKLHRAPPGGANARTAAGHPPTRPTPHPPPRAPSAPPAEAPPDDEPSSYEEMSERRLELEEVIEQLRSIEPDGAPLEVPPAAAAATAADLGADAKPPRWVARGAAEAPARPAGVRTLGSCVRSQVRQEPRSYASWLGAGRARGPDPYDFGEPPEKVEGGKVSREEQKRKEEEAVLREEVRRRATRVRFAHAALSSATCHL